MRYQTVREDGSPCCDTTDFRTLCGPCQAAASAEILEDIAAAPPDPYKDGLAHLRAAEGLPLPQKPTLPSGGRAPNPYASVLKGRG